MLVVEQDVAASLIFQWGLTDTLSAPLLVDQTSQHANRRISLGMQPRPLEVRSGGGGSTI